MIFVIRAIYNAEEITGANEVIHWAGVSNMHSEESVRNEVKRLNQMKYNEASYYDFISLPTIPLGESFSEEELDGKI